MKKKLQLNELNVQSFVTHQTNGGSAQARTRQCTIGSCTEFSLPADQCATTDNACPTLQAACPTNPVIYCLDHSGLCSIKTPCPL